MMHIRVYILYIDTVFDAHTGLLELLPQHLPAAVAYYLLLLLLRRHPLHK